MNFEKLEDIKKELGIQVSDATELRRQLRKRLSEVHPDQNGGDFTSDNQKTKYYNILEAIQFLDGYSKNEAMIPISEVTELIKVTKELIVTNKEMAQITGEKNKSKKLDHSENSLVDNIKARNNEVRKLIKIPTLTLVSFSAILSFVYTFPFMMQKHPVLSNLIDIKSRLFFFCWTISIIISITLWFIWKIVSDKECKFNLNLQSSTFQMNTFMAFISSAVSKYGYYYRKAAKRFTRDQLVQYIIGNVYLPLPYFFRLIGFGAKMEPMFAENFADVLISRLETQKAIRTPEKIVFNHELFVDDVLFDSIIMNSESTQKTRNILSYLKIVKNNNIKRRQNNSALEQALDALEVTSTTQIKNKYEAKRHFKKAITMENGERLALSYIGMALCEDSFESSAEALKSFLQINPHTLIDNALAHGKPILSIRNMWEKYRNYQSSRKIRKIQKEAKIFLMQLESIIGTGNSSLH